MRRPARTRSLPIVTYWVGTLSALGALAAWQFEWVPFDGKGRPGAKGAGDQPVAKIGDEHSQLPVDDMTGDPAVFSQQSEPSAQGQAYAGTGMIARTPKVPTEGLTPSADWDSRTTSSMPGQFTTRTDERAAPSMSAQPTANQPIGGQPYPTPTIARERIAEPIQQASAVIHPEQAPDHGRVQTVGGQVEFPNQAQQSDAAGLQLSELATNSTDATAPELREIDAQLEKGSYLDAHRVMSKLYWSKPELRSALIERIEKTAESIYFSPQPHYMEAYVVKSGDVLQAIANRYQVSWEYLTRLNRVDPRKIREGQKLKVIKGPFSAVVDLSDFEMIVHAHGYFVRRYQVGIGRDGATPVGKFTVLEKVSNPQYTDPDGKVFDSDDPANPLGERWLDLGDGYGIHGTIEPDSIGKAESRGCIRMRGPDVEEVYDLLTKGSEVIIRR